MTEVLRAIAELLPGVGLGYKRLSSAIFNTPQPAHCQESNKRTRPSILNIRCQLFNERRSQEGSRHVPRCILDTARAFEQSSYLLASRSIMTFSTARCFVVSFIVLSVITSANANVFATIKNFVSGANAVKSPDCIEAVVTKARAGGSCDGISQKSLAQAATEALECFRGPEAPGVREDVSASSSSLRVIALTLQKYCYFQSKLDISEDVTGVAKDLNALGHSASRFGNKLAMSLRRLQLRGDQRAANQRNVASALESISKSETSNAGVVTKMLNRSTGDLRRLMDSRNETNSISNVAVAKLEESRQLLRQTQRILTRFSDTRKPPLGAHLPHVFLHTATFLSSLHLADSIQFMFLSGKLCVTQASLLLIDIVWTAVIPHNEYTMTVNVAALRSIGLACFLFHFVSHYWPTKVTAT